MKILDDEPCSICLEEFVIPNRIIVLACEHKFHSDCIKSWIYHRFQLSYVGNV